MDNNIALAACVLSGEEGKDINIEAGEALKTNLSHEELKEKTRGIETLLEAKEFSKETGAEYYILDGNRENERITEQRDNEITQDTRSEYNYRSSRSRTGDKGFDR